MPVSAGGGVHIERAVEVIHFGRVGGERNAVLGNVALFQSLARDGLPVYKVGGNVSAHADFAVERRNVEIIFAVVPHDEGIADAVALPLIFDRRVLAEQIFVIALVVVGVYDGGFVTAFRIMIAVGVLGRFAASRATDGKHRGERENR